MAENELKWYDIFVPLFGTILSIADPITDILTLVLYKIVAKWSHDISCDIKAILIFYLKMLRMIISLCVPNSYSAPLSVPKF